MLINSIEQLKEAIGGIQQTMNWRTWKPFVQQAEMLYIVPAIGQELYAELDNATTPTAKQTSLLTWLRISIAEYADLLGGMRLVLHTSDAGKQSPSGNNMQSPGKWMIVAARKEAINKADLALEHALQFLETNAADFPTWRSSGSYTYSKKLFISSATELTTYFPPARQSRRVYLALRDYLAKTEHYYLKPLLGEAQYATWKEKLLEDESTWSALETEALQMLRYLLAYQTFFESITFLNIDQDWRLISETDGISNEEILPTARRQEMRSECQRQVQEFQSRLTAHLMAHASDSEFADYFSSSAYKPARTVAGSRVNNSAEKKYYGF
jgi:hypothetical protein